ncbi:class F sortase [Candidatus Saccharibacteria bacterium]|nr:class F sortase [Candidatus Saccharibacteria bacterium]
MAVIAGVLLVIFGYQPQREPSVGWIPSQTAVFTRTEPTPVPTSAAHRAVKVLQHPTRPKVIPIASPALPKGEPAQVVVATTDGKRLVDTSLVPTVRNAEEELVPPFGKAGWYAEAGWSKRKPGFPGPSVVAGHISHRSQPDVFYNLPRVRPGDVVSIKYTSGDKVSFRVTRAEAVRKDLATDLSGDVAQSIWQPSGNQSVIRLFTCDPETTFVGSHYLGNWVVWANKI